jgi:hypothetical protein
MKRLLFFAMVAALGLLCRPAQAIVVVATNTVNFSGIYNSTPEPSYQLSITYDVTENNSGLYTYNYDLVTTPAEPIYSFSIGGVLDPIDTATMVQSYSLAEGSPASAVLNNSVVWEWAATPPGITSDDVSFTSDLAPGLATFTVSDDDILWNSPGSIPAPVTPVPEPSAFALLTGLAFGCGLFWYRRAAMGIKDAPQFPAKKPIA